MPACCLAVVAGYHPGMTQLTMALAIKGGIVAAAGAGGKKSLLYTLARENTGRVAYTATVHSTPPPDTAGFRLRIGDEAELIEAARQGTEPGRYAFLQPSDKPQRLAGISQAGVAVLHTAGAFALTLVKADGARMRALKAPAASEPVLPESCDTLVYVLSASALGAPLDADTVHRPERFGALTGAAEGQPITAEAVASLVAIVAQAARREGVRRCIPIINQVDDSAAEARARVCAEAILDADPDCPRVVLTRLVSESAQPVVAILDQRSVC